MRLLLAEDEKSLSKAINAILEKNNFSVDVVYDGKEALQFLKCEYYDGLQWLDDFQPKANVLPEVRNYLKRQRRKRHSGSI